MGKTNVNYQDVDFTRPEQRVAMIVSSEDIEHKADDIYNDDSLGSVWRTRGYWLISSSNDTIVFRDESSVDIEATIDSGEYHSDAAFFAEIKSKMEAEGAHTYTISRNADTKKIRIASSHSFFEIRWTDAANNMAELLGFPPSPNSTGATIDSETNDYGYNAATIALHTEEFLQWDFGSPVKPSYFAAIGQPNDDLKLTSGATMQLQFNNTSNFSSPSQTINLTYNTRGLFLVDEDGICDDFYRYARFRVVDRENVFGFLEFAKISMGSFLNITKGAVQFPLTIQGIDKSTTQESLSGQLSSVERSTTHSVSMRWFALDAPNKDRLWDHFFRDYKTARSFFIFLDRDAVFSTSAARSFIYARYANDPSFRLVNRGALWEANNQIRVQL